MITLHTWTTPNGRKPVIMLEELGWPYRIVPVDLGKGEQFRPEFLALSPNNKIPAMADDGAGLTLFESGAILCYLAERSGQLLAAEGPARYKTLAWLYWQIGGLGPMLGQLGSFAKEKDDFATEHFLKEAGRLLGVLDKQLSGSRYVAGEDYTIADIACYTWAQGAATRMKAVLGEKLDNKPGLQRWLSLVGSRPAVQRGMAWKVS
jgi:GST-like protein